MIKLAVARSPCSRQSFRKVGKTEIWHPSEQDRSFTERPSARDGSGCTPYTKQTLALERGLGVRHLREPTVSGDSRMASTSLICVIASRRRICRNRIASSDATLPTIPNQTRNPSPTRRYRPYLTQHVTLPKPPGGASSKKKSKKRGGGGGVGNDAALAERMRRLMEPLPEDRPPRPEEWSRVEKGAGVAKSAAKKRVSSGTSNSTAVDPAFAVLPKFEERNDDARDGDDAANENAVDLDSYAVSAPFYHAFQDTGARAWCAIVTSASGFDSDPVPITAAVPRMRKIKGTAPAPVLEKEEKREVVEEFRRRQREARKAEKANKPNKPKKKKGKGEEDGEGDENETVSMNGLVLPKTLDVDDANAARILHTLFARAPYEAPAPAREQQYAQQPTQTFTQKQVHAYHHHHHQQQQMLAQQQQMLARQQQQVQDRQFLQDWSSPGIASQQQQVLEAQSAQMADMQRQLAAALQGQEEAVRIANQAQMAAAHAAAAAASAQASAHRNAGMRKENWRSAPGAVNETDSNGRKPASRKARAGEQWGPPPGFAGSAPPGFGATAPPGFEAPAAEAPLAAPPTFGSNSYVPPAFRQQ